ncbi:hypothetical protein [Brumimicrobium mesophilum]|uniref:hypothetical protein n=1 Tax=Brumimicrobium mesophilum TaxID=392717 RepID=UPI000D142DE9|nr:hypothetical protein [Brumimicrobium mesophilum]
MNSRFQITQFQKSNIRIKSLVIKNDVICEFYVRLYSFLGANPAIHFEGFTFQILDNKNDFSFEASLTGFGAGYFAEEDNPKTKRILNEFHEALYAKDLELKECSFTYEHDFGETNFGYQNGQFLIN